jgi:hypothetical protein
MMPWKDGEAWLGGLTPARGYRLRMRVKAEHVGA